MSDEGTGAVSMRGALRSAVGVAIASCLLLVDGGSAIGQNSGFQIHTSDLSVAVLGSVQVSGSGCPAPNGASTVHLILTPPTGANGLGTAVIDGHPVFVSQAVGYPGEVWLDAPLTADGTFAATIQVPADAPPVPGYTVLAGCASLLDVAEDGVSVSPESFDAATAVTSAFAVTPAPIACDAPVDCPDDGGLREPVPAPIARPIFTG